VDPTEAHVMALDRRCLTVLLIMPKTRELSGIEGTEGVLENFGQVSTRKWKD
jgi:hypothetical protein